MAAGVGVVLALAATMSFGPIVRWAAIREASLRHVVMHIGKVRPAWGGARLRDVEVRLEGVDECVLRLDDVRLTSSWLLQLEDVEAVGGALTLVGPVARIAEQLTAWSGRGKPLLHRDGPGRSVSASITDVKVRWTDGASDETVARAEGVRADWSTQGLRAEVRQGVFALRSWVVTFTDTVAAVDRAGAVRKARARVVAARWTGEGRRPSGSDASTASSRPTTDDSRSDFFLGLPDANSFGAITTASRQMQRHILPGANIGIDEFNLIFAGRNDGVPLVIGPGSLSAVPSNSGLDLHFLTASTTAGSPFDFRAFLPDGAADALVSLTGGPLSLSALGIRDGAAGLEDVDKAMLAGHVVLSLAADGSEVRFDGNCHGENVSVEDSRLATDVVRGLDLELRARGAFNSGNANTLRLDEIGVALGSIRLSGEGDFEQQDGRATGRLRVALPASDCQSLLQSVPRELLPTLDGTVVAGRLEAHGELAFDTHALDDLALDYDIENGCSVVRVPPALAIEQFDTAFEHRIYLPDGSLGEQVTGPGTSEWTPLDQISPYMQIAVLTSEDGAFFSHHGFNRSAIRASLIANLKGKRFVRGASTITMQLAKNLFLSRRKTVSRKLEEVLLTHYLEQSLSKPKLIELYLNVIEFGPAVYGIKDASEYYFGREPSELNLAECMFLASILPAPLHYASFRDAGVVPDGWMHAVRGLMASARRYHRITEEELAQGNEESVLFWNGVDRPSPRPPSQASLRPDMDAATSADPPIENTDDGP
jgi:hypothetical protein